MVKGIGKEKTEEFSDVIEAGLYLHPDEFKEEVRLVPQTLADRPDIIRELAEIVGVDKFVQGIGEEKVIRSLGEERVIRSLGEENLLKNFINLLGKEKIKKMLEE
ncbi:MAG: hypothetical protein AB1422_09665 [bacterium]